MQNLSNDHPHLSRRVRLKSIVHILMGILLMFAPTQAISISRIPAFDNISFLLVGAIYLIIGLIIGIGLFRPPYTYRLARFGILLAMVFNTLVFLMLLSIMFEAKTTAFVVILYGYFLYNISYIAYDPGWRAIYIISRLKEK